MKKLALTLALMCAGLGVSAQDRAGNDTPGEWKPTHFKGTDLWDSVCDERTTGDVTEERCYIRYVDVFSQRPEFAAQFVFITPDETGLKVDFGVERRTTFEDEGFQILSKGQVIWALDRRCRPNDCAFEGKDAMTLIEAMTQGDAFQFAFNDRHGNDQTISWNLANFERVLADFYEQAQMRGLLSEN